MKKASLIVILLAMLLLTAVDTSGAFAAAPKLPKEIHIAVIAPLTGPLSGSAGLQGKEGTTLAAKLINQAGGIRGSKIVLDFFDDRADPAESVIIAQRVADDPRFVAVIAHFSTDSCFATLPIYEDAGLAMVTPWASHADLTKRFNVSFRFSPSTEIYGGAHADLVTDCTDGKKVAVIYAISEYTMDHQANFKKRLLARGGKVVAEETFYTGDIDFTPQLTNIRRSGADVLAVIGYIRENAFIIRQAREMGLDVEIAATSLIFGPEVEEITGQHLNGVKAIGSTIDSMLDGRMKTRPEVTEYYRAYKAEYGKEPVICWDVQAYDAVRVIARAVEQVGVDQRAVLNYLKKLRGFQGVTGTLFSEDRAMVPEIVFVQYDHQKRTWRVISDLIDPMQYVKKK